MKNIKELDSIGSKFGEGSQKDVYYSSTNSSSCICLIRSNTTGSLSSLEVLRTELSSILLLQSSGLPVVSILNIVSFNGRLGIERELVKGAIDSDDVIKRRKSLPDSTSFNKRIISSCDEIINRLTENPFVIEDLQFLINQTGDVYINDVRSVTSGFTSEKAINQVKELRGFAKEKLLESSSSNPTKSSLPVLEHQVNLNYTYNHHQALNELD
ncbi:hypothetical protein L3V79_08000 [Thiotrichales bacterium 19S9-12]|nr:hypothetical protein [Thiotrichales bacterium 19S9-11]MCF6812295.1 hypothetical protein [Thiotrichales bacterium 19S9-12]